MPVVGPRFLIEAGFIIVVAVIAGIEKLGTLSIVGVMAGAWLIVAAVEITISQRRTRARAGSGSVVSEPAAPATPDPPVVGREPSLGLRPESVAAAPLAEQERKPEPAVPRIAAVPPPLPEPELLAEPEPEPEPGSARVVAFTSATAEPREWNLWELDRVIRDHASGDLARDEERSYLLMYLREFAGPDGVLPADFDGLVRDAFGDVLHSVAT